jgi:LPXTG-motif cell wall-anchored protein
VTPAAPAPAAAPAAETEETPAPTQAVKGETAESPAPAKAKPVQAAAPATLPFTGADAGVIALLGAASLAGGLVLRRRMRESR